MSFNKMIKNGLIKRGDKGMRIQFKNIHVREGFNKRDRDDELEEHIGDIVKFMEAGGDVPQLEVLPIDDTGVWVVDGHCRREGYSHVKGPDDWIDIRPFEGDYLDALTRIGTSQEGKKLRPIELANLYQETRDELSKAKGKQATLDEVGQRFGKTRQYVDQILKLLTGDEETKAMVKSGQVSAAIAVKAIREHGADAGAALKESLADAKAQGKSKVTDKTLRGPSLPRALLDDLHSTVGHWRSLLDAGEALAVEKSLRGELQEDQGVTVPVAEFARLVAILAEAERALEVQKANAQAKADKAAQLSM